MQTRVTKSAQKERIDEIVERLMAHVGRKVLLVTRTGRVRTPVVGKLMHGGGKLYAALNTYGENGSVSGTRGVYVDPVHIYTGELEAELFDDGV